MNFTCCDICDANEDKLLTGELAIMQPIFRSYGQHSKFAGPAKTLQMFEENMLLRATLETPGNGQVLVVDGGGSMRCGMLGGNLGKLAATNGWAGVILNGCIRDSEEINACAVGVRALASFPRKSARRNTGQADLQLHFADVTIRPGDWIYVDQDGILVARTPLH